MRFFLLMALVGCATIHKPVAPEDEPVVTYFGTASGAATIVRAQGSIDLAHDAMDNGLSPALMNTDRLMSFTAGSTYPGYASGSWGYAPVDVTSTVGGWYAPTGYGSSLPKLGTTVTDGAKSGMIVPCPKGRDRTTPAEQAACAEIDATQALSHLQRLE
jgi:hypothetical protein